MMGAMRSVSVRSGVEVLDEAECRRLLAQDIVGRIAVVVGRAPVVLPVNYALDGDAIVVRTMPGSKLDAGRGPAAFEIDGFDRTTRSGWSVLVSGRLEEVTELEAEDWKRVSALAVEPWAAGRREQLLRLRPSHIGGRVIRPSTGTDLS